MKNLDMVELNNDDLENINGGAWPLIVKVGVWIVGAAAAGITGYYAVEAVQGIEDGLSGECCDCQCN